MEGDKKIMTIKIRFVFNRTHCVYFFAGSGALRWPLWLERRLCRASCFGFASGFLLSKESPLLLRSQVFLNFFFFLLLLLLLLFFIKMSECLV